ncbi:hypothetical protein PIIN_10352 [Serendipita indica DSM 11827]|uniref:Uncharacterized protein n=1 Tax=Serendipita indica (strain DSM 11827) TaxID=1109443 RepID=G4TYG6_SERID|nr:hypothetical protein PIIN_10352 [Serendipita indica DSM 11827]
MAEFPGIAQTFAEVIDQTSQAQEDLEELSRSGKAGGYTVACLSTETILLRRTLRKLHEYCQENQRLLKGHSKTTAKDINLSLLSTSLALSEIKIKARKITLRGVSVRTPRLRLFERAKKEDNELNPLLCKLRDHSILLWSLYLILDPFAEPDEEVFQLRTHVRIMLRQTEDDINQQPNVKCMATRPDYISTLWLTRVSPLPLTKELIHHGLSHDQIHTIYGNSSGRPFIAKQVLLRWRSYGTENDFRVALNLLISTGYDLMLTDEAIRSWRSYGVGDMYSMFLGLLASSRYDLPKTEEAIQTLLTWESHSTVEEYQLCLDLLGTNYYDVRLVDEAIRDFQSCGRDLYPILLKASHKAYFNVRLIRQLLRRATVLMTRRNLPDQTSLALENLPLAELTPPNCQHLINAMELKGYELLKVVEELEILRRELQAFLQAAL